MHGYAIDREEDNPEFAASIQNNWTGIQLSDVRKLRVGNIEMRKLHGMSIGPAHHRLQDNTWNTIQLVYAYVRPMVFLIFLWR